MLMTFEACRFGRVSGFWFFCFCLVIGFSRSRRITLAFAHFGICFVIRVSKAATCY